MKRENEFLRRYTQLPYLIEMLENRYLVIPSWKKWQDKNDSHSLMEYQRLKEDRYIFALCMTNSAETFHHWQVFTKRQSGVCLTFKKRALSEWARNQNNVKLKKVIYFKMNELDTDTVKPRHLPFVKRWGFRDEQEWRLTYETPESSGLARLTLPISALESIDISPMISQQKADNMKDQIRSALSKQKLTITHSELTNSPRWKDKVSEIASTHRVR